MNVEFLKDTPYTKREGSKKKFIKGNVYTLDNSYARELIAEGCCRQVEELIVEEFLKPKKEKNK